MGSLYITQKDKEKLDKWLIKHSDDFWTYKGHTNARGYSNIRLSGTKQFVHRAVYAAYVGPIPENMVVCHRDDNPKNNAVNNLFLGTHKDNVQDMLKKGRGADRRGSKSVKAKLTLEEVKHIRYLSRFYTGNSIARWYGMSGMAVNRIIRGISWGEG